MQTTQRAYNGPKLPCNLTDRNEGVLTGLPTCCRVHRKEATQARLDAQGCPCNPHRPLRTCTNAH